MKTVYKASIKERDTKTTCHPQYVIMGDADVQPKFFIDFWGLKESDVESYFIVEFKYDDDGKIKSRRIVCRGNNN